MSKKLSKTASQTEGRKNAELRGIDQARRLQMQRDALRGYAKIDLFGEVKFKFGLVNARPIDRGQVTALMRNFTDHGILRYSEATAIPLVVPAHFYDEQSISQKILFGDDLPMIEWTQDAKKALVEASGGQHRFEALKGWKDREQHALEQLKGNLTKRLNKNKGEPDDDTTKELRREIREAAGRVTRSGWWMAFVYDAEMVNNNAELKEFLAENTTLHVYKQTTEERMINIIRELNYAEDTNTFDAALRIARDEHKANDGHTGMTRNIHAVKLFCRLIRYDQTYQGIKFMTVDWAKETFGGHHGRIMFEITMAMCDRLDFLFTSTPFATFQKVKDLQTVVDNEASPEELLTQAKTKLKEVGDGILGKGLQKPQRRLMTTQVHAKIEEIFTKHIINASAEVQFAGQDDASRTAYHNYIQALIEELPAVVKIDPENEREVGVLEHLKAKILYLGHETANDFFGYIPLMSVSMLRRLETWLGTIDRTLGEVSHIC